jgi:hypothetical protein
MTVEEISKHPKRRKPESFKESHSNNSTSMTFSYDMSWAYRIHKMVGPFPSISYNL